MGPMVGTKWEVRMGLIFTPVLVVCLLSPLGLVWAYDYSTSWTHETSKQSCWKLYKVATIQERSRKDICIIIMLSIHIKKSQLHCYTYMDAVIHHHIFGFRKHT